MRPFVAIERRQRDRIGQTEPRRLQRIAVAGREETISPAFGALRLRSREFAGSGSAMMDAPTSFTRCANTWCSVAMPNGVPKPTMRWAVLPRVNVYGSDLVLFDTGSWKSSPETIARRPDA